MWYLWIFGNLVHVNKNNFQKNNQEVSGTKRVTDA